MNSVLIFFQIFAQEDPYKIQICFQNNDLSKPQLFRFKLVLKES